MTGATPRPADWPGPDTAVAGIIGDPIRHSLSPRLHQAAYSALGLDRIYLTFEVPPADFDVAVQGARALGLAGLSVTMPHKEAAAALATRRSGVARRLGAANTLTFRPNEILADSTDGVGLLDDLREWVGFEAGDKRCGVIGAGGAARAVVLALAEAGAAEVLVVNRTQVRAFRAAALAPRVGRVARPAELQSVDLVVKAVPSGMPGVEHDTLVDPSRFGRGQLVVDLVYHPRLTPFLRESLKAGARTRNGLGMLVHQAAHQIELWTGTRPPLEPMWAAVDPKH